MSELTNNYKKFSKNKRKLLANMENNQKKTTTEQFTVLVKEMQKNPNIDRATPIFGYNRTKMETFWNSLTSRLNALGPKQRTASEWKNVWSELKLRTKRKNSLSDLNQEEPSSEHHHSRAVRNTGAASSSFLTSVNQCQGHSGSEAATSKQHKCDTPSPSRISQIYAKSHGGGVGYNSGGITLNNSGGGGGFEHETLMLLRRQLECEENLVNALQRSNELKLQQLKLMEQQNQLLAVTIEGIQQLSSKFMEFLEKN